MKLDALAIYSTTTLFVTLTTTRLQTVWKLCSNLKHKNTWKNSNKLSILESLIGKLSILENLLLCHFCVWYNSCPGTHLVENCVKIDDEKFGKNRGTIWKNRAPFCAHFGSFGLTKIGAQILDYVLM